MAAQGSIGRVDVWVSTATSRRRSRGRVFAFFSITSPASQLGREPQVALPEIQNGRLVQVLRDWTIPEGGIQIVFPDTRFRPAKVRHFVEMLVEAERARLHLS